MTKYRQEHEMSASGSERRLDEAAKAPDPPPPKGIDLTPDQYPTPPTPPREFLDKVIVATWTPGKGWKVEARS